MFPFVIFCCFIMAVILPSSRSSKGKPSGEVPLRLEQHLPKSAQALVPSLSEDDREVLNYMLAFGLHMQMLAGLVLPASKLQWKLWKTSSVKVGLKRNHASPLQSGSGMPRKDSPLFAHKPSCTCDCFSCYSSFWRRWAASPNKDLLNMIIEIAEMSDEGEEQKATKGKEKKKQQEKKHIQEHEAGGRKAKGGKWKLQSTPQTSATTSTSENMVEATPITEIVEDSSGGTSMDMMYDALWDNISMDALCITDSPVMPSEMKNSFAMKDVLLCRTEVDTLSSVTTMKIRSSSDARVETSSWVPSNQGRAPAIVQDELDVTQALSPRCLLFASRQGKNNLTFQLAGKRKSNQITPLVFEGTFVLSEEDQDSSVWSGKAEGSLCLRPADANLRGIGFLSRIFPGALCGIASRLWDLVSMGSPNNSMDYY